MLPAILLLIFFINVESTPNSRVTRALPPRYLDARGFKKCLVDLDRTKPGGQANIEYCFPLSKPSGCPNRVWKKLKRAYNDRKKRSAQRRNTGGCRTVGGSKDPYKPCVFPFIWNDKSQYSCVKWNQEWPLPSGGHSVGDWCSTKVDNRGEHVKENWGVCSSNCPAKERQKVKRVTLYNKMPYVWRSKNGNSQWVPICGDYFWDNHNGAKLFCKELGFSSGRISGGTLFNADRVTLPEDALKIGKCSNGDSWLGCTGGCNDLGIGGKCELNDGNCNAGARSGINIECTGEQPRYRRALPPGYLDVPGYDQCLEEHSPPGSSHTGYCRPATKPDYCSKRSWNDLKNVFDGINCPSNDPPFIGGINGLPPAYLDVPGHQQCLEEHYPPGQSSSELCLPASRPDYCASDSYDQLLQQILE